jgi:hypothetical protein
MTEPTQAQVSSACLSFRHDYGLLSEAEQKAVQFEAREWLHAWRKEGLGLAQTQNRDGISALIRVAAECHRKKWQFDSGERRLSVIDARNLVNIAFNELHRIGDMALKEKEALAALAPGNGADQSAPDFKTAQDAAESDPSVRPDCSGADTGRITTEQLDQLQFGRSLHERPGNGAVEARPHKTMTLDEYLATPLRGWHSVCFNIDGFGGVGVRYHGDSVTSTERTGGER